MVGHIVRREGDRDDPPQSAGSDYGSLPDRLELAELVGAFQYAVEPSPVASESYAIDQSDKCRSIIPESAS